MTVTEFFVHFENELKLNPKLTDYHRVINDPKLYEFRKSYIAQRMEFVLEQMDNKNGKVWDVGCGFGTTSILLALNGYEVMGTTLEYYYDELQERLKYWGQFGDLSKLSFEYKNIFDESPAPESFDYVLAQDTLHHLEPFNEAVKIFHKVLRPGGKVVVSEENGNNVICSLKLLKQRGFKRIKTIYDEKLQKEILIGDENTRNLKQWRKEFSIAPFTFDEESIDYIRYYFPGKYKSMAATDIVAQEQKLWKNSAFKREFMFFGINFSILKN